MTSAKEFYEFFDKIPREKWTKGSYKQDGCMCALGHLGVNSTYGVIGHEYASNLSDIFRKSFSKSPIYINDCSLHVHPKDNILEALQIAAELGY